MMSTEILFIHYDYGISRYMIRSCSRFLTIVRNIFDSDNICKIKYKYLFKVGVNFFDIEYVMIKTEKMYIEFMFTIAQL